MSPQELSDYFRTQVTDRYIPYLWTDDEVLIFMNEAQNEFCRLTEGISDATTAEVVEVQVSTGELFSDVHPSILSFRQATLESTGKKLNIVNHTDVTSWVVSEGDVSDMIIGMERNKVRWGRTPVVDDQVNLLVFRLPLEQLTASSTELEVDVLHHASLVYWMQHMAYMKPDTETFDKKASDRAKANFIDYCMRVSAEQRRYKQKPRVVAYGGL